MNGPVVILLAMVGTAVVVWIVTEVEVRLDRRARRREWAELYRYSTARRRVDAWQRHPSNRTRLGHGSTLDNDRP